MTTRALLVVVTAAVLGCGGASPEREAERSPERPVDAVPDPARAGDAPQARPGAQAPSGIVSALPAGDAARLALAGESLFRARGCARCHSIGGGDMEGPDLAGVTLRRSSDWILAMLTQPEFMAQTDPDAQQLLIEHFVQMPDLEITREEAEAIHAYLDLATRRP